MLKINSFIVWKYLANGRTGGETGPFAEAQYEHGMTQRFHGPREERLHNVRFSNRPFGVKHFRLSTVAVSMSLTGSLVLLFGIGTKAPAYALPARSQSSLR